MFSAFVAAPLIVVTLCFVLEVLLGLAPVRQGRKPSSGLGPVAIIVPAHNEELMLAETLRDLSRAADEYMRTILIADNCTDRTSAIGHAAGVEVVERSDPHLRGKGYALDQARSYLKNAPPEIVVIMDADCTIDHDSLSELVASCHALKAPVQAIYLQTAAFDATPIVQLSTFAFYVRNCIRQRGLQRLSQRVHLVGTGMAFPWPIFAQMELATSNIVEDLHSGLELTAMGFAPTLAERATVWTKSATQGSTLEQRRRWEGGYLQTARAWVPRLLRESFRRSDMRILWAAISLAVPPFALLIGLDVVVLVVLSAASWAVPASVWPAAVLACSLFAAVMACTMAWLCGGRRFIDLQTLIRAPLYVAWKVPLYLNLARAGAPKLWERTDRER